ncbi:hypothetical protein SJPD1_1519 [Sulfurospirillum diekertiae]|uniref:Uncharacterized protein n=1 Tax=Sulfurospirillum diekertiae TaxID=1854492 RepID=A0A1Y0HL09_9BACT|nr:hypothetical protein Sdiek1_1599 [Sulfurospirillum diekertiae]ASC93584.1 hypothetical protein Sdiek2_1566 [Sulfurospirillum diekertiae]ATB69628.1 hypothetical protein SJPD1_1519 [Sulfurospirillum diekertiae]
MGVTNGYKKKYISLAAILTCAVRTIFFSEEVKVNNIETISVLSFLRRDDYVCY